MKNTAIVLGDSPFLKEVEDKIRYVLDRYHSIGINNVITKYYTDEHIFLDKPFIALTNQYLGKTVTLKVYDSLIHKDNKCLLDILSFDFHKHTCKDICNGDKLAWKGFTHDFAITYCIRQGFKKVILIGAGDFTKGGHFSNPHAFQYSYHCKENSKKFIEEYTSKLIQIETCNPKSYLRVPRVSIDDLLK